jgi:HisJ family histidinol phosphate phosphatase
VDPSRSKGSGTLIDPRISAIPDIHGHAKGEHRPFAEERPIAYSARMLFLWFYHACRRNSPRFLMVADHINYLTFEDPGAVHTVRRALKLAQAGDLYGAAETAGVDVAHAAIVSEGLRRGMHFSIGAEADNDPRARPDAQNIVDAMRPDGIIRSVHFLPIDHPEKGADWQWPYDNPEFAQFFDIIGTERLWEVYTARLFDDLQKLPAHVVGHFYKPAVFGHWPDARALEAYEHRLLEIAQTRGLAVEINTRPLYRDTPEEHRQRYIDANKRLMRKAKERGVGIAVGSDAHSPRDQGGAFDVLLRMLDECEINELVFPVAGRLARVVLRATREHLEQRKPQEPVQPGSSITGFSRAELGLPEEIESKELSVKPVRDVGPKKRASSPERITKKPTPPEPTAKNSATSKRTPESAASSARAKAAKPVAKPAPKKAAPAKSATAKKSRTAKPVVKKAPAKKASTPARAAAAKKAAPKKAAVKKSAVAKKSSPATKKSAAKKAPVKKAAAKTTAKTAKRLAKTPAKGTTKKKSAARRR